MTQPGEIVEHVCKGGMVKIKVQLHPLRLLDIEIADHIAGDTDLLSTYLIGGINEVLHNWSPSKRVPRHERPQVMIGDLFPFSPIGSPVNAGSPPTGPELQPAAPQQPDQPGDVPDRGAE